MNNEKHEIKTIILDDKQIDLLVDGELSLHQQKELLTAADKIPATWRQIALAYIESQQWKNAFSQLVAKPVPQNKITSSPPPQTRSLAILIWAAVAASLLFVVSSTSYHAGKTKTEQHFAQQQVNPKNEIDLQNDQQLKENTSLSGFSKPKIKYILNENQPEITTLLFKHPDTGETIKQKVLVIDPNNPPAELDQWISQNEGELPISEPLQTQLKQQGITAKITRQFYAVPLENGRLAIVPVESTRVDYHITENTPLY